MNAPSPAPPVPPELMMLCYMLSPSKFTVTQSRTVCLVASYIANKPSSAGNMMNLLDGLELSTHPSEASLALFATISREIQIYVYAYFLFTTHHNFYIATGNCNDFPT